MSWIHSTFGSKFMSPLILFILVILSMFLFLSALLLLLLKFIHRQRSSNPNNNNQETSNSSSFRRQLQHLFHLHDSGLDQSHIDALPMFLYKDVMGLKQQPFDCAVCLCEFTEKDRLRLLPLCTHAFHADCIDKWLLSNSTCPLCRGVILSNEISCENPVFYLDDEKEIENGFAVDDSSGAGISEKRVFSVRLGKLKSTTNGDEIELGESVNSNLDDRRCYSMGSFQYVVADSEMQVAFCRREEQGVEGSDLKGMDGQNGNISGHVDTYYGNNNKISRETRGESFSVSKIWMWSKKGKLPNSLANNSLF